MGTMKKYNVSFPQTKKSSSLMIRKKKSNMFTTNYKKIDSEELYIDRQPSQHLRLNKLMMDNNRIHSDRRIR
jgi:hypothetical protein